jgi:phosphohistidine phosphatase
MDNYFNKFVVAGNKNAILIKEEILKRLILVRHAKSDWSYAGLNDFDRPLNERGYANAHMMGEHMKKYFSGDEFFISSPAIRAITTAIIFAKHLNYDLEKIKLKKELYEADESTFLDVILKTDDSINTVFIFGHNPAISEVLAKLVKGRIVDVPTCCVSEINFESEKWSSLENIRGILKNQFLAKQLEE